MAALAASACSGDGTQSTADHVTRTGALAGGGNKAGGKADDTDKDHRVGRLEAASEPGGRPRHARLERARHGGPPAPAGHRQRPSGRPPRLARRQQRRAQAVLDREHDPGDGESGHPCPDRQAAGRRRDPRRQGRSLCRRWCRPRLCFHPGHGMGPGQRQGSGGMADLRGFRRRHRGREHRHRRAVRSPGAGESVPRAASRRLLRPQLQLVRPGARRAATRRSSPATTTTTAPTRWARWSETTALRAPTGSASRRTRSGSRPRAANRARAARRRCSRPASGSWRPPT